MPGCHRDWPAADFLRYRTGNRRSDSTIRVGGRADHVRVHDAETRNRIAKRVVGEIARAHGQRRHQAGEGNAVQLIFLFAIDEEKGLVLLNGAADGAAKLVQVELFRGGGEVALGIERGIAHEIRRGCRESCWSRILWSPAPSVPPGYRIRRSRCRSEP